MYSKTVTIFNYYESATTGDAYWYPHVLSNVDLNTDRGAIIKKYGSDTADNAILHIRYTLSDDNKIISEKERFSENGRMAYFSEWKDTNGDNILDTEGNTILLVCARDNRMIWLPPKAWKNQTNDMLEETITFSAEDDFFWEGEWNKGVVNDDDYRGGFYQYMNENKDNVFKITSVGGPYTLIPHFEILGK